MSDAPSSTKLNIELLDFDPKNPRFLDIFGQNDQMDAATIERMLEEENIHELVGSIGQQGYFPGEPLLVTKNPANSSHYIVVEGNRRLAALRLLCGIIPAVDLPPSLVELISTATERPNMIECFEFSTRKEILRYLGFRHISGPRRWEPLSKARYLADLIANFYPGLNSEEQYIAVARDIGSRRDYVAQLLTALHLYDLTRARNYFDLQRLEEKNISFSLITTALSYRAITDFLKLNGRDDVVAETLDEGNLKSLLSWMFVQDEEGNTVLQDSRRLKLMAAVVSSEEALEELKKTRDLDRAYVYTDGPSVAMTTLLDTAMVSLTECSEMVMVDIVPDDSHLAQIERIIKIADNFQLLAQKNRRQRERQEAVDNA